MTIPVVSFVLATLSTAPWPAPQDPPPEPQELPPTIVVEGDFQEIAGLPKGTGAHATVTEEDLFEQGYRTLPQALRDVPQVLVQETSHGQGSPYLRGFTGFQNVLLVDGIRLNKSVFRSGPNQYWNTVDAGSLDRLIIEMGPSSALYGSDALGGVVRAITRSPYGELNDPTGKLIYRYSDAADFHIFRAEGSWVGEDTGILLGLTAKDFGDVEGGKEVGLQPGTGYDETDADLKIEHWLDENSRIVFGHYRVNQNDVPRTHSTVDGINWEGLSNGSDLSRRLDQNRELTYLQYHRDGGVGIFDAMTTSLSWHNQTEERVRVRSDGRVESQGFDVGTLGITQLLFREGASGSWIYGLDYYRDGVDSFLDRGPNQTAADDIQGPVADDASYQSLGLFAQDRIELNERTALIAGGRFTAIEADADSVRDPVTDMQTAIDRDFDNLSFSLQLEHALQHQGGATLYTGVTQGFRAPNLSDLTRFDTARSNEFEVPSVDLEEEKVLGFELGVRRQEGATRFDVGGFYTDIEDGIVRFPTGNTNSDGDFEVTKANVGDGHIWGWVAAITSELTDEVEVHLDAAYQRGEQETFPTSAPVLATEPIDRTMPFTMHAAVRWKAPEKRGWVELRLTHASKADELSTRDEGDTSRIPPGGTPGFSVLDLRSGWKVNRNVDFTVGLENLFDEDYRVHGSGVNRPGRGLTFGLVLSF